MSKNIIRSPYRSKSTKRPNAELHQKPVTTEEDILNTRRRTIPVPFIFHNTSREKRSETDSTKAIKTIPISEPGCISHRSTRLMLLSTKNPIIKSPRSIKSALKSRPTTCSPNKKVQFKGFHTENQISLSKQKQWKKILSSIKTTLKNEVQHYCTDPGKRKTTGKFRLLISATDE